MFLKITLTDFFSFSRFIILYNSPCYCFDSLSGTIKPCLAQRRKGTKFFYYSPFTSFTFWTPCTLILDTLYAHFGHPLCILLSLVLWCFWVSPSVLFVLCFCPCGQHNCPDSRPHFGHHVASFWTPVLHGVFSSPWRVALRRNRFPIPVMTEHNPPKQPFWTPCTLILDIPCAEASSK